MTRLFQCFIALLLLASIRGAEFRAGAARVDITPDYPIRLTGYASRTNESQGVAMPIYARALAISSGDAAPALIITVDNCAVGAPIREELLRRLQRQARVFDERLALCSTHSHTAPALEGSLRNILTDTITPPQRERIRRYTAELIGKLEQAALEAIENLQPARLYYGQGSAGFAKNRRTEGGPVDHDVPVLAARAPDGSLIAAFANYACHCTTLQAFNQIHGDWAGIAATLVEKQNPGAVALVAIGCGADSNPLPRGRMELAEQYGGELGAEINRLLQNLAPIESPLSFSTRRIDLPFDPLPTEEEWRERAAQPGIVGYHARKNLERLERGEAIPQTLPYLIQTWNFGGELALIFLPGEVVVDYALRLKREFDPSRIWVNAYANDVPCYIPSRRILAEGGYEAESSLWYYDQPARLSPAIEDTIISTVHQLLPDAFEAD